jgi:hypothetical protein
VPAPANTTATKKYGELIIQDHWTEGFGSNRVSWSLRTNSDSYSEDSLAKLRTMISQAEELTAEGAEDSAKERRVYSPFCLCDNLGGICGSGFPRHFRTLASSSITNALRVAFKFDD